MSLPHDRVLSLTAPRHDHSTSRGLLEIVCHSTLHFHHNREAHIVHAQCMRTFLRYAPAALAPPCTALAERLLQFQMYIHVFTTTKATALSVPSSLANLVFKGKATCTSHSCYLPPHGALKELCLARTHTTLHRWHSDRPNSPQQFMPVPLQVQYRVALRCRVQALLQRPTHDFWLLSFSSDVIVTTAL